MIIIPVNNYSDAKDLFERLSQESSKYNPKDFSFTHEIAGDSKIVIIDSYRDCTARLTHTNITGLILKFWKNPICRSVGSKDCLEYLLDKLKAQ